MLELLDKYIDTKGIVVSHPGTLGQQLEAVIAYAETLEYDCLMTEKQLKEMTYERDAYQLALLGQESPIKKKLDAVIKEIRMPIDNPKCYSTEVINWSKYLLAEINRLSDASETK
jgi:hypothetical protein